MSIADVLDKAADLIEPEGAWIQHDYARDMLGNELCKPGLGAICFCMVGAINEVAGQDLDFRQPFFDWIERDLLGNTLIGAWNDSFNREQSEVVAKLREAAAKAREQGL